MTRSSVSKRSSDWKEGKSERRGWDKTHIGHRGTEDR